jgi:hypothetical protein
LVNIKQYSNYKLQQWFKHSIPIGLFIEIKVFMNKEEMFFM